jgi:NADP-dependent 3-hydroxy acid dehydrogenase YdfG
MEKAEAAIQKLKAGNAAAKISTVALDLGDLSSVKACANRLLDSAPFDVVLNNAGECGSVLGTTALKRTAAGLVGGSVRLHKQSRAGSAGVGGRPA